MLSRLRAAFPALARQHHGRAVAYFDGPGGTRSLQADGWTRPLQGVGRYGRATVTGSSSIGPGPGRGREITIEVAPSNGSRLRVRHLEVVDGTPVIDVKPVLEPLGER